MFIGSVWSRKVTDCQRIPGFACASQSAGEGASGKEGDCTVFPTRVLVLYQGGSQSANGNMMVLSSQIRSFSKSDLLLL